MSNKPFLRCSSFPLFSQRVLVHNISYSNEFDLQDSESATKSHLNMKGCVLRLVLKQRQKQLILVLNSTQFFLLNSIVLR